MRVGSFSQHVLIAGCMAAMAALALPRGAVQTPARGRSVAITLDDGPVVNELKNLANFQRIAGRLREALVAVKVPATIFINEGQLNVPGSVTDGPRCWPNGWTPVTIWATTPTPIPV